jgi:hypothetical protein
VILGFALFFMFFNVAVSEQTEVLDAPKLMVTDPVFDFGSVVEGEKVEHVYQLINDGESDLVIQRVVASCGCLVVEMPQVPVAPKGQADLKLVFDTQGFFGAQEKLVRVFTNDPKTPALPLTLRGRVDREISAEPLSVSFGDVYVGKQFKKPADREVVIRVRDGSSIVLEKIVARSRFFEVKQIEASKKQMRLRVNLRDDKDLPLGDVRERLVVIVSGGKIQSLNVPLLATLRSAINLRPEVLSLGVIEGPAIIERRVDLLYSGEGEIEIRGVSSDHAAVKARIEEARPGRRYSIFVSVDPSKVEKELRGLVSIDTTGEDARSLALPVYGILPPERIK